MSLHYLLTNLDLLQWMGAIRMRVQTSDKNITIIHNMTPVHQLMSCEVKSCMFLRNNSSLRYCNFKSSSEYHNSTSKVQNSLPTYLFRTILDCFCFDGFITNTQLFTSQDVNWLTGVEWIICGLLWCFYQPFGLSFWRHPFTAENPLVSKWCNAKFLQICSDEETNVYAYCMAWWWVKFQKFSIFG